MGRRLIRPQEKFGGSLADKRKQVKEDLNKKTSSLAFYTKQAEEAQKELGKVRSDLTMANKDFDKMKINAQELRETINKLEKSKEAIESLIAQAKSTADQIIQKAEKDALNLKNEANKQALSGFQTAKEAEKTKNETEQVNSKLLRQKQDLEKEVKKFDKDISDKTKQLGQLEVKEKIIIGNIEKLTQKAQEARSDLDNINKAIETAKEQLEEITNAKSELKKLHEDKDKLIKEINGLKEESESLKDKVRQAENIIKIANERDKKSAAKMQAADALALETQVKYQSAFKLSKQQKDGQNIVKN